MAKGKFLHLFMNATPLQQAMFMLCMAWAHLSSLTITQPKMKELVGDKKGEERDKLLKDNAEAAFYTGKVVSSQFYHRRRVPEILRQDRGAPLRRRRRHQGLRPDLHGGASGVDRESNFHGRERRGLRRPLRIYRVCPGLRERENRGPCRRPPQCGAGSSADARARSSSSIWAPDSMRHSSQARSS